MTACVNCTRALQPDWKYCIFCGTRTARAAAPRSRPIPKRTPVPGSVVTWTAPEPIVPPPAPAPLSAAPREQPVSSAWPEALGERPTLRSALAATEVPAPTPGAHAPVSGVLIEDPPEHPDPEPEAEPEPEPEPEQRSVNSLAILALVTGIVAVPFAALFGHLALGQLRISGERGVIPAWIAIVLGYLWLGFWIVFGITYFATNG